MNQLSFEMIQVFQGEGGTVESLLGHVASLTSSLADKDAVIGSVIDDLNTVVGTVAARDQQLSDLVVSLQQFVSGLSADRDAIFDSLQTIDGLAVSTTGLLDQASGPTGRRHPGPRRPVDEPGRLRGRRGGLPAAHPDQAGPDHPHGGQRQLVQLLPLLGQRLRRAARPDDRRHDPGRDADSGAEGCG